MRACTCVPAVLLPAALVLVSGTRDRYVTGVALCSRLATREGALLSAVGKHGWCHGQSLAQRQCLRYDAGVWCQTTAVGVVWHGNGAPARRCRVVSVATLLPWAQDRLRSPRLLRPALLS